MQRLAFLLLCVAAISVSRRAYAQEPREGSTEPQYTLEGESLRVSRAGASTVLDLGCEGRSVLRSGTKLLVACGSAGVVEFDLTDPSSPRRDGIMHVEGDASGLFLHDRAVWVEVSHVDAAPVRIGNASAPSEPPTRANVSRRAAYGYLEATSADGHAPDQTAPSDAGNEPPSIISPPRRGDLWELSLLMSAFVPTGSLGVGALGSASVTYRFGPPFVVRAEVAPFGIAGPTLATTTTNPVPFGQTANPSTTIGPHAVTSAAAHLVVGLDTQFVELGLGAGGATVNQSPEFVQGGGQSPTGSVSMVEEGRLGARDGLAVIVESSLIATNQKFNIGYFVASFQIPLSRSVMLVARGGGGNVGFAYGDLGLRVLVRGDGGRKTLALTGFLGGAGVVENLCSSNPDPPFTTVCDNATLAGPSLGGGVEWRP